MNQVWTSAVSGDTPMPSTFAIANVTPLSFVGALTEAEQVASQSSTATSFFIMVLDGTPDEWSLSYEVAFAGLTNGLASAQIYVSDRNPADSLVYELDNTAPLIALGAKTGTIVGTWRSSELPSTVSAADVFNYFLNGRYYFNLRSANSFLQAGESCSMRQTSTMQPVAPLLGLATAGVLGAAAQRENRQQALQR
jgi:hypothetical protein